MATIKVKQIKSRIGANKEQKSTLLSLGLHKISQVIEVEDTPSIRAVSYTHLTLPTTPYV